MQNIHYDSSQSKVSARLENVSVEDIFVIEEAEIQYFRETKELHEIIRIIAISLSITDKDLLKMVQKQQQHLKNQKFRVEDLTFDNGEIKATISQQAIAIPLSVTAKVGLSIDPYGGLTIDFPPLEGALGLIPIPVATIARQILEADEKLSRFIVVKQKDSDTISIVPRISWEKTILLNPSKLEICDGILHLTCLDKSAPIQNLSHQITSAYPFPPTKINTVCQCRDCKKNRTTEKTGWLSSVSRILSGSDGDSDASEKKCLATADELVAQHEYHRALRKLKSTHSGYLKRASLLLNIIRQPEEALRLCNIGLDTYETSQELSSIKALALSALGKDNEALQTLHLNEQTKLFLEGQIYLDQKDLVLASRKFEESFAIEPFNSYFITKLAETLRKRKHRPRSVRSLWTTLLLLEPDSSIGRRNLGLDANINPSPAKEALEYTAEISERVQWFGKNQESDQIKLSESIICRIAKARPEIFLQPEKAANESMLPVVGDLRLEIDLILSNIATITGLDFSGKEIFILSEAESQFIADKIVGIGDHILEHCPRNLLPHVLLHTFIKTNGLDYKGHHALPSILATLIRRTALESIKEPEDDDGLIGNFLSSKVQEMTNAENKSFDEGHDLDWWLNKSLRNELASLCRTFVNTGCNESSVQKAITNRVFAADRALCLLTRDFYSSVQVILWKSLSHKEVIEANKGGCLRYLATRAKSGKDGAVYSDLLHRISSLTQFATNIDSFISDESVLKPL
jgi:tetratricopeptide (TPR) repeat protein